MSTGLLLRPTISQNVFNIKTIKIEVRKKKFYSVINGPFGTVGSGFSVNVRVEDAIRIMDKDYGGVKVSLRIKRRKLWYNQP